jgi:hypothetical protein
VDIKTVDDVAFAEISSFADCVVKLMTVVSVGSVFRPSHSQRITKDTDTF